MATHRQHSALITLLIDGIELETCVDCAIAIVSGDPRDEPVTDGCQVCDHKSHQSTKPPAQEEAEGVRRYEAMIKNSGCFKAAIGHIAEHMEGVA